ncbi:MAG: hypothetical protein J0L57_00785 [Burkholderiales bacterium]|nr:hypothetical protein [Burkholderiales bacterium]
MTAKTVLPELPAALAEVALCDIRTAIAPGNASPSWWLDGVRRTLEGDLRHDEVPFPQPVIRRPRFTRWRVSDVARFWREFTERHTCDALVIGQAKKASAAARAKREAEREAQQAGA